MAGVCTAPDEPDFSTGLSRASRDTPRVAALQRAWHPAAMTPSLPHEPRSRQQIAAAIDLVREVLGDAVLAAYLYGSAIAGGLRPMSDLDILVVSDRALTGDEQRTLVGRLLPLSGCDAAGGPARSLEVSILSRPALVPWRYPPSIAFQYGDWLRAAFERGELPAWPHLDPDVTVLVETAHRAAVPLVGPPLAALLPPVPRADLVRALHDTVPVLMPGIDEGDDIRNGLLTLARVWSTLETGAILPKDKAADWALARLPEEHRDVLAHARAVYLGDAREDWAALMPRLRPHVDHVAARIRGLAPKQTL
jgi:streptomycin 3"-adenylyltransferase